MHPEPIPIHRIRRHALPFMDRLAGIYADMDRAYAAVAEQYGFHCNGCTDNCCLTRFYHHTLLEYLYLAEGLRGLSSEVGQRVIGDAKRVREEMEAAPHTGPVRIMCPLNRHGQCLAYAHRPMICRLHGIPHELRRADGGIVRSPGCDLFTEQCLQEAKTDYIPFDRTPHYQAMAILENDLRRATGYTSKIKLTVAQMIVSITDTHHEID